MSNIIQELEAEQMGREVPEFNPGDTIIVQVKVKEGDRERLQAFEGLCQKRKKNKIQTKIANQKK